MKRLVIASILVTGGMSAQFPYGAGTPAGGGFVPVLGGGVPYFGDPSFGISVASGPGGAAGVLGLALAPAAQPLGAGTLWIDLNSAFAFLPFTLSGTPGAPGAGSAFLPFPLPASLAPALAGFRTFLQAGIADPAAPSGLALTNGWEAELTLSSLLFAGSGGIGPGTPHAFYDPLLQVFTTTTSPSPFTNDVIGAVFANGGADLYLMDGSVPAINHVDLRPYPPSFQTIQTFGGFSAQAWESIELDRRKRWIWTVARPSVSAPVQLYAIDVDPASPTRHQIVAQTTTLGQNLGFVGAQAVNPAGTLLATSAMLSMQIRLWDVDPASPTFLQPVQALYPPASGIINDLEWSANGDELLVLVQAWGQNPGEVARWSLSQGLWFDHNPSQPFIQNIGYNSSPWVWLGIGPVSLAPVPQTDSWILSSWASGGSFGRLDLSRTNPGYFAWTPSSGGPTQNAWRCVVDPQGARCCVASDQTLAFYDIATMALVRLEAPGFTATELAWR